MWDRWQIAADAYIDRLAFFESSRDGGVDRFMSIFKIVDNCLITGDSLEAPQFLAEIRQANRVMQNAVCAIVIGIGPANDTDEGKILAVGTGNGIEDTEAPNSEGNNTGTDTTGTGIAISGISCIKLIAAANETEAGFSNEVVKQGKVEITGNREDIAHTDLD